MRNLNFSALSLAALLGGAVLLSACGGGLKAGAGIKLDAKGGLQTKAEFKASTQGSTAKGTSDSAVSDPAVEAVLDQALLAKHRSEENKARDAFRHPKETLSFFGLRTDMSVLEVEPGADASYIEILAPVLRDKGKLTVTNHDKNGPPKSPLTKDAIALDAKLTGDAVYEKVATVVIEGRTDYKLGEPESYDMVITFRNLHLWKSDRNEARVYKAIFAALKPGGVFGVVQHRACAGSKADRTFRDGYLPQQYVIDSIEKAGFVFEAESSVNSNWKDTRDYPRGVWSLPPVLAMGERDKEKMMAIGESDRMTLRFRKPLTAEKPPEPADDKAPATEAKGPSDKAAAPADPKPAEAKPAAAPAPKAPETKPAPASVVTDPKAAGAPKAPAPAPAAPKAAVAPKVTVAAKPAPAPAAKPAPAPAAKPAPAPAAKPAPAPAAKPAPAPAAKPAPAPAPAPAAKPAPAPAPAAKPAPAPAAKPAPAPAPAAKPAPAPAPAPAK